MVIEEHCAQDLPALEHFPIHWIPVGRRKCV